MSSPMAGMPYSSPQSLAKASRASKMKAVSSASLSSIAGRSRLRSTLTLIGQNFRTAKAGRWQAEFALNELKKQLGRAYSM